MPTPSVPLIRGSVKSHGGLHLPSDLIVHAGVMKHAADLFAVCEWGQFVVPNDPTHTSSEETGMTEHVPAKPPLPLNYEPGMLYAETPGETTLAHSSNL